MKATQDEQEQGAMNLHKKLKKFNTKTEIACRIQSNREIRTRMKNQWCEIEKICTRNRED
jgi:hypothetical protein